MFNKQLDHIHRGPERDIFTDTAKSPATISQTTTLLNGKKKVGRNADQEHDLLSGKHHGNTQVETLYSEKNMQEKKNTEAAHKDDASPAAIPERHHMRVPHRLEVLAQARSSGQMNSEVDTGYFRHLSTLNEVNALKHQISNEPDLDEPNANIQNLMKEQNEIIPEL